MNQALLSYNFIDIRFIFPFILMFRIYIIGEISDAADSVQCLLALQAKSGAKSILWDQPSSFLL